MKRKQIRFIGYCLAVGLIAALNMVITSCSSTSTSIPIRTPPSTASPTLSSIVVIPISSANLVVGSTRQFVAIGTYSDSSKKDLTFLAIWASSHTETATISLGGLAKGVAAGNTDITAAMWGVTSPPVSLTVVSSTSTTSSTLTTTP